MQILGACFTQGVTVAKALAFVPKTCIFLGGWVGYILEHDTTLLAL